MLFNGLRLSTFSEICNYLESALGRKDVNSKGHIMFNRKQSITVHNSFFNSISSKSEYNWVDIEVEYYRRLLRIIDNVSGSGQLKAIKKLNFEADLIFQKFEGYLVQNVIPKIFGKENRSTEL